MRHYEQKRPALTSLNAGPETRRASARYFIGVGEAAPILGSMCVQSAHVIGFVPHCRRRSGRSAGLCEEGLPMLNCRGGGAQVPIWIAPGYPVVPEKVGLDENCELTPESTPGISE